MTVTKQYFPVSYKNEGSGTARDPSKPIGHGADSDTYGYVYISGSSSGTIGFRYSFDAIEIPAIATVTSVVCRAKVRYSGTASLARVEFRRGKVTDMTNISTTAAVYEWNRGAEVTPEQLADCSVFLRVSKSGTTSLYAYFYGAEITVGYDIPLYAPDVTVTEQYRGVRLSWAKTENAQTYRILRDGVQLAETDGTSYTDGNAWDSAEHTYTVYSVYDGIQSEGTTVTVPIRRFRFVTDRTAADVAAKNEKGTYNASDLNRVAEAVGYVRGLLDSCGYAVPQKPKSDWLINDIPAQSAMQTHIDAVRGLDVIRYSHDPIVLPVSMAKLDYEGANNIEKFLIAAGEAAEKIPDAWMYAGEIFGGEI